MESLKPDCQWALQRKEPQSLPGGKVGHFLQSGLRAKSAESRRFPRFSEEYSQVSTRPRLRGGGRGIRTLGTDSGVPLRPAVSLTYGDFILESSAAEMRNGRGQTSGSPGFAAGQKAKA
jgi:hypothetical protein